MRFLILIALFSWAGTANATDDFGSRFGNESPAALESDEQVPDAIMADHLGAMEPAAGDETQIADPSDTPVPAVQNAPEGENSPAPNADIVYE